MASRLTVLLSDLRDSHHALATQVTTLLLTLDVAQRVEGGYLIDEAGMRRVMEVLEMARDSLALLGGAVRQLEETQAAVEAVKATRPGTTDKLTLDRLTREI